jgi:hypothetical protein
VARKVNVPLLCIDCRTGIITRYQRGEFSHVHGAKPPLMTKQVQVPEDWQGRLNDPKVLPLLEGFRKTGETA